MKTLILLIILSLSLQSAACGKKDISPGSNPPAPAAITNVAAYFPSDPGLAWVYEGSGNEYAGFTRKSLYHVNSLAQFTDNNGGTSLGLVYQITTASVILVYAVEEHYTGASLLGRAPNRQEVLLQAPLSPGANWQDERYKREVLSTSDTITVPSGTYSKVIKVKITSLDQPAAEHFEYYAPGIGLIAREFVAKDSHITSKLKWFGKS